MSEETTESLEGSTPFEARVLRELANLNRRFDGLEGRLTGLEEGVDVRLRDTRPIWEAVLSRLDSMEARLDGMDTRLERMDARLERIDEKFEVVAGELLDVRAEIKTVKKRLPAA